MKKILLFTLIAVAFSSCKNLVPYTDHLKAEHKWSIEQVKHIQFYLSHEILVQRKLVGGTSDKIHGKVVTQHGEQFDQIYFKKGLKVGMIDVTSNNNYIIQCESQEGNTLTFGVNPNKNGKFVLLASEWIGQKGKVHYADTEYYTNEESAESCLLIDLRQAVDEQNNFRVAGGYKVK